MSSKTKASIRKSIKEVKEKNRRLEELKKRKVDFDAGVSHTVHADSYSNMHFETIPNKKVLSVEFVAGYEGGGFDMSAEEVDELITFLQKAKQKICEVK